MIPIDPTYCHNFTVEEHMDCMNFIIKELTEKEVRSTLRLVMMIIDVAASDSDVREALIVATQVVLRNIPDAKDQTEIQEKCHSFRKEWHRKRTEGN
jgi:hypothetical protein